MGIPPTLDSARAATPGVFNWPFLFLRKFSLFGSLLGHFEIFENNFLLLIISLTPLSLDTIKKVVDFVHRHAIIKYIQ